jgi:LemA protein
MEQYLKFIIAALIVIGSGVIISGIFIMITAYNSLISLREEIKKSWANIDVILKQRFDEIPQIITICQQFIELESEMVEKVMNSRLNMIQGRSLKEKAISSNEMSSFVNGLISLGESYPDLKSNNNFMQIQERLSSLEEALADRRELYNDTTTIYNTRIQQFPYLFIAGMIRMMSKELFPIPEEEKVLPKLNILKHI